MSIRKIQGKIKAMGQADVIDSDVKTDGCSIYDYIRFDDEGAEDTYLQAVWVTSYIDSLIRPGVTGTFYLVQFSAPRMFGSRKMFFLYAVAIDGKRYDGTSQSKRIHSKSMNASALMLFGMGAPLLLAFGIGLLLLIQALRLLLARLPEAEMASALRNTA